MSNAQKFKELLKEKIIVFDGAMGTSIQNQKLQAEDFGGLEYEGCNEMLSLTRPDVVQSIHESFLEAGADVVETNTFGSTPLVLAEYDLQDKAHEISKVSAEIARKAVENYSTADHPRFICGSMGPTTKSMTVTGGVEFDELVEHFTVQAKGLIEGGSDLLLLETSQDTRNVKAGIIAIHNARKELNADLPLMVSGTIEPMGTMLAGQGAEAFYTSLEHADLLSIGLNCATGPQFMTDHLRSLSEIAECYISCIPNAGLPDEEGNYNETPESVVAVLEKFVNNGWVNILGGCCGTTPEYIASIARMVQGKKPRIPQKKKRWHVSGIDYFELKPENRPAIVGERTNVIGSRKFKRLIVEEKYEEASEIGRKQVRNGAQIVDVCLANPDREEKEDIEKFLSYLIQKIKAPIMLDTTDPDVLETALQFCQGKSIINSINLEDGEERFQQIVPLAKKYGAALVVGCIDEDPKSGMAITRERKLEIAKRSYDLLVNQYGVRPENIIYDPLVFPCATGDEHYIGSAEETIKGIELIKKELPETLTVLGISNVSFGLPPAGREILNATFLYHCTKAGLDMAIVNPEKLERYASIPDEEKKMADDLLFNRGEDPIATFAAFYKEKKVKTAKKPKENRSVEERLADAIVEGSKEGLSEDLDEALKKYKPLEVINGPLMEGMDEVGKLFGNNELIVAEVLQSAEVMKTAVAHLEKFMDKGDIQTKGKMLLATVKGDVHDIGKNLVEIILSNNGYEIINLGIKIPPEELIKAQKEHNADMIGLSGLLVKSAQQMVTTAHDLKSAGIDVPILVGGAALSNRFTRMKIAPEYEGMVVYSKDAMTGLELANQLIDEDKRQALLEWIEEDQKKLEVTAQKKDPSGEKRKKQKTVEVTHNFHPPTPPDLKKHVLKTFSLEEIFLYLNNQMLLGKHLGLRGNVDRMLESGDAKAVELNKQVREMQDEIIEKRILTPRAVYQFFPAKPQNDTILFYDSSRQKELDHITFPRQLEGNRFCLSDFVAPDNDHVCMFVTTTADQELYPWLDKYRKDGEFLKNHMIQAIAIESAEAFAELLHEKIRTMWGIPDSPDLTTKDKFHAKYRGIRVSFGYPACPRMEDQTVLFNLLDVENAIGVQLTEGYMMEPEASVSALVFHHPQARYFNISDEDYKKFEQQTKLDKATA